MITPHSITRDTGRKILANELASRGMRGVYVFYNADKRAFGFRLGCAGILNASQARYIPEEDVIEALNGYGDKLDLWLIWYTLELRRN